MDSDLDYVPPSRRGTAPVVLPPDHPRQAVDAGCSVVEWLRAMVVGCERFTVSSFSMTTTQAREVLRLLEGRE